MVNCFLKLTTNSAHWVCTILWDLVAIVLGLDGPILGSKNSNNNNSNNNNNNNNNIKNNIQIDLFLPGQFPLSISTLSIAISPVNEFPAIPSNITCEKSFG